jgi:predicted MPP superfamily phosphohydrolase
LAVLKQTQIKILNNEVIDINGLQVMGIGYPGIKDIRDIQRVETLKQDSAVDSPCILLFHTPTNINPRKGDGLDRQFSTYWVPDTNFAAAQKLGADLQLSGHTHAGQIFPFGYLTKLLYKGFDHGIQRLDGFTIHTSSGVGTWGPPMRTGNRPEIVAINLI